MLVYGDPQFQSTLLQMLDQLSRRARLCDWRDLDDLRALLIQTGQLEQAVADSCEERTLPVPSHLMELTNLAAAAFVQLWNGRSPALPFQYSLLLDRLRTLDDVPLTVKTPEGFEFYSLYPEQYLATAKHWAGKVVPQGAILVIGIRSIGTTLSALVTQTLLDLGVTARRLTVRLGGHPYHRQATLDPTLLYNSEWALVVDEGPGASGSSMAGTATALIASGLPPERIAFFPGHNGEPGPFAAPHVRQCWARTPRYFTPLRDITWSGKALEQCLLSRSGTTPSSVVHDLGGGQWRKHVFPRESDWPPVAKQFERAKFLVQPAKGPGVLWKFVGLGSWVGPGLSGVDEILNRARLRAALGWTSPVLGMCQGFLATPWAEGRRLTPPNASPEVLRSLALYLAQTAGPPLDPAEHAPALFRLDEMLRCNWTEAFGAPPSSANISMLLQSLSALPMYTDGRMAPYEWTIHDHSLIKVDCGGHTKDHTRIGKQSILWDVAGAIIEWHLDKQHSSIFLAQLKSACITVPTAPLHFFKLAYVAFNLGLVTHAMHSADAESARLQRAREFYYTVGATLADTPDP